MLLPWLFKAQGGERGLSLRLQSPCSCKRQEEEKMDIFPMLMDGWQKEGTVSSFLSTCTLFVGNNYIRLFLLRSQCTCPSKVGMSFHQVSFSQCIPYLNCEREFGYHNRYILDIRNLVVSF